jgi:hypothetical protein
MFPDRRPVFEIARSLQPKALLSAQPSKVPSERFFPVESNLHSPERRLIELRMEHADLDALIDKAGAEPTVDELLLRRLKKRRLLLRDEIAKLELQLDPKEPA